MPQAHPLGSATSIAMAIFNALPFAMIALAERRTAFAISGALVAAVLAVFLALDVYAGAGASAAAVSFDSAKHILSSQYWPATWAIEHVLGAASAVAGLVCAARAVSRGLTAVNRQEDREHIHAAGGVASTLLSPQFLHHVLPVLSQLSINTSVLKSAASWLGMVSKTFVEKAAERRCHRAHASPIAPSDCCLSPLVRATLCTCSTCYLPQLSEDTPCMEEILV